MNFKKIVLLILIAIWMTIIFIFSNQPSKTSGEISGNLSRKILSTTGILEKINIDNREKVVITTEKVIRKIAHFSIYTILGINVMGFFRTFEWNTKKQAIFTLSLCILYAISDEIHQFFSDGRAPLIKDVFIDSFGSLFGILIILGITNLMKKVKTTRKSGKNEV